MTQGPIDLIRLVGEGNSVVLRIKGKETRRGARRTDVLTSEFVVETPFISGTLNTWLFPADLTEWQQCLDALDAGQDITWRDATRAPALSMERDETGERLRVTIRDNMTTLTTVTVTVPMADSWFDDAYDRLEQVSKTWPPTEDH
ncbi:DUF5959 family protein (plasmid) [Streptomyces sp. NBC_01384]|uniref:DUF5959 family protein n=1 Tax=Streptomyces sp. NBC_01384 TaxID=2903847 RepID=UPI002F90DCFE